MNLLRKNYWILILIILVFNNSCNKKEIEEIIENPNDTISISEEVIALNEWIYTTMQDYYLWENHIENNISYEEKADPEAFFYELLYEEDKWSWITDDYESLNAELSGTPLSMGYSPSFGLFSNTNEVFIIVEFVYPGTPADVAGLERGDIILTINGQSMDTTNYYDLYSGESYTVGLGTYNGLSVSSTGETIDLTAEVINADPSVYSDVVEIAGEKIGYLVYTGFTSGVNDVFLDNLDQIFDDFKSQGITDLVLDLRYNPGGEIDVSGHLASAIAPFNVVVGKEVLVSYEYNDFLNFYFDFYEGPDSENLVYKFPMNIHNLDLTRVYVLTTSGTASASELIISGLDPYMDVITIGESTYGKYVGAWVIPDLNSPPQHNWAMVPTVLKYANSEGETDYINGLMPDYEIDDNLLYAVPFGNLSDPLFAKAVELITETPVITSVKSSYITMPYLKLWNPENQLKQNLIIPFSRDTDKMILKNE